MAVSRRAIAYGVCAAASLVMPGLVPAIHVFAAAKKQDMDARHQAGHDEN
jgi:hypothetical protein